jgi:hypothetical protein
LNSSTPPLPIIKKKQFWWCTGRSGSTSGQAAQHGGPVRQGRLSGDHGQPIRSVLVERFFWSQTSIDIHGFTRSSNQTQMHCFSLDLEFTVLFLKQYLRHVQKLMVSARNNCIYYWPFVKQIFQSSDEAAETV